MDSLQTVSPFSFTVELLEPVHDPYARFERAMDLRVPIFLVNEVGGWCDSIAVRD